MTIWMLEYVLRTGLAVQPVGGVKDVDRVYISNGLEIRGIFLSLSLVFLMFTFQIWFLYSADDLFLSV